MVQQHQIVADLVAIIGALGSSGVAAIIAGVITLRWGGGKQTPQEQDTT